MLVPEPLEDALGRVALLPGTSEAVLQDPVDDAGVGLLLGLSKGWAPGRTLTGCAPPWGTQSAGSERRPTTSRTPSAWWKGRSLEETGNAADSEPAPTGLGRRTLSVLVHNKGPASAVQSLEGYFRDGRVHHPGCPFTHTCFVAPDAVRWKTPFFPDRVQRSREHYPKLGKGASAASGMAETAALTLDIAIPWSTW